MSFIISNQNKALNINLKIEFQNIIPPAENYLLACLTPDAPELFQNYSGLQMDQKCDFLPYFLKQSTLYLAF